MFSLSHIAQQQTLKNEGANGFLKGAVAAALIGAIAGATVGALLVTAGIAVPLAGLFMPGTLGGTLAGAALGAAGLGAVGGIAGASAAVTSSIERQTRTAELQAAARHAAKRGFDLGQQYAHAQDPVVDQAGVDQAGTKFRDSVLSSRERANAQQPTV